MNIVVVDRWRNVRIAPTKAVTAKSNLLAVLDGLLKGQAVHTGQIEFECDKAFHDLVIGAADANKDVFVNSPEFEAITYKGVPLKVVG